MGSLVIINALVPMLVICLPIIFFLYLLKSAWFKGIAGEFLVHISAKIHLNKYEYQVLRNVTLPTEDGTTQIDHIIVSEYGVFVVETKNMKGWIYGGSHQRMWTQKIYKYTDKFQNPLHQNHKHVETLKSFLGLNDQQIFSLVVFVGDSTFKTAMPENVTHGSGFIRFIKYRKQPVISDEDVQGILAKIETGRLAPSSETNKAHINHVKHMISEKQSSNCCPKCGGFMVIREAENGPNHADKWLGCSRFPQCRGTATIPLVDAWEQDDEIEFAFTDSWEKGWLQNDETQSAFTDRAFQ